VAAEEVEVMEYVVEVAVRDPLTALDEEAAGQLLDALLASVTGPAVEQNVSVGTVGARFHVSAPRAADAARIAADAFAAAWTRAGLPGTPPIARIGVEWVVDAEEVAARA
jgi:hypothetical protein